MEYSHEDVEYSRKILIDENTIADSVDITSFVEEIEVIPIIEKDPYFVGDIYKIFLHKDKFIIFDRVISSQVLLFNKQGEFEKRIISKGFGPLESLQINDCWLNNDGSLDAYDFALKKVYHFDSSYSLESTLKGEKNIYHSLARIPGTDNFLGYSLFNSYNDHNYQLAKLDNNLEATSAYLRYNVNMKGANILSFRNHFHPYEDTIRFMRSYDNTIYNLVGGELKNGILLEYKNNSLDRKSFCKLILNNKQLFVADDFDLNERNKIFQPYSYYNGNWVENKNNIILTSINESKPFTTIFDKNTNKVVLNSRVILEKEKYKMAIPPLTSTGDGYFIGVINSLYLKYYLLEDSTLQKFADPSYNSFLIIKLKLKNTYEAS